MATRAHGQQAPPIGFVSHECPRALHSALRNQQSHLPQIGFVSHNRIISVLPARILFSRKGFQRHTTKLFKFRNYVSRRGAGTLGMKGHCCPVTSARPHLCSRTFGCGRRPRCGLCASMVDVFAGHGRTLRMGFYVPPFSCVSIIQSAIFRVKENLDKRRTLLRTDKPLCEVHLQPTRENCILATEGLPSRRRGAPRTPSKGTADERR